MKAPSCLAAAGMGCVQARRDANEVGQMKGCVPQRQVTIAHRRHTQTRHGYIRTMLWMVCLFAGVAIGSEPAEGPWVRLG